MSDGVLSGAVVGLGRVQSAMWVLAGWSAVALLFAAPTSRALFNLSALLLIVGNDDPAPYLAALPAVDRERLRGRVRAEGARGAIHVPPWCGWTAARLGHVRDRSPRA